MSNNFSFVEEKVPHETDSLRKENKLTSAPLRWINLVPIIKHLNVKPTLSLRQRRRTCPVRQGPWDYNGNIDVDISVFTELQNFCHPVIMAAGFTVLIVREELIKIYYKNLFHVTYWFKLFWKSASETSNREGLSCGRHVSHFNVCLMTLWQYVFHTSHYTPHSQPAMPLSSAVVLGWP